MMQTLYANSTYLGSQVPCKSYNCSRDLQDISITTATTDLQTFSYHSKLPSFSYACYYKVVTIQNLESWLTDTMLLELFASHKQKMCKWMHRESSSQAFIGCYSADAAKLLITLYNQYQYYFASPSSDVQKCTLRVEAAPMFIEKRFAEIMKPTSLKPKTVYLRAVASAKLQMTEWWQLFPNAFDIYKTIDQPKALIHFCTIHEAEQAFCKLNKTVQTITLRDKSEISIMLACNFVNRQYVYNKRKQASKTVAAKLEFEEQLADKIVEWLYL